MPFEWPTRPPLPPKFLQQLSTDEYLPLPYTSSTVRALQRLRKTGEDAAPRVGLSFGDYMASRLGTAAGLRALNQEAGDIFYDVKPEAEYDMEAAAECFRGDYPVIDIQTHYVADRPYARDTYTRAMLETYPTLMPSWFRGLDDLTSLTLADYIRCVFLETETAAAVLTAPPGQGPYAILTNEEMAATRFLIEELGGRGRLLNHAIVHPDAPGELERMEGWRDRCGPIGWKVYTHGHLGETFVPHGTNWMLDDERTGIPFCERARELGVTNICAHKGLTYVVDTGSPSDLGPAATNFPDLNFVAYHSGYEFSVPFGDSPPHPPEGPYTEDTADIGVNRMVTTVRAAGLAPGSNVYAELGTTWFCLIRHPDQAAHVLGKLLVAYGEDNILWGSDSIWYGATQQVLDAFRAFQIPLEFRQRYGYPELTLEIKEKILSRNTARLYGMDLESIRANTQSDDLAWARHVIAHYDKAGTPTLG
jgi:uncharacterized protein